MVIACLLLSGCGIGFGDPPEGNEFFESLNVTGDKRAGEQLTAAVAMTQNYAVEITVECELRRGKDLVKPIGRDVVPAFPNGTPDQTPFPINYSFDFTVDDAGTYKVDCFTPLDEDNFIRDEFKIGAAAEITPMPTLGASQPDTQP